MRQPVGSLIHDRSEAAYLLRDEEIVALGHGTSHDPRRRPRPPARCRRSVPEGKGLPGTTMEDIARQAGVSRATVYRYFPSRESVVSGVILRAAERYLDRMRRRIAVHRDLGTAILDFVEVTVRAAHREPTIGLLFGSDEELAGVGLAKGTSVALFELVAEFLRPVFAAHWDQLEPGVSVDDAAEWILRTVLSLLSVRGPRHRSPEGLDAFYADSCFQLCSPTPSLASMQQVQSSVSNHRIDIRG